MSESPRRPGLFQEDDRVSGPWASVLTVLAVLIILGGFWWGYDLTAAAQQGFTPFTADRSPPRTEDERDLGAVGAMNVTEIVSDSTTRTDRERRSAALEAYGWVDRDSGIVTIPIRRAMEIVAEGTGHGPAGQTGAEEGPGTAPAAVDTTLVDTAGVAAPSTEGIRPRGDSLPPDTMPPQRASGAGIVPTPADDAGSPRGARRHGGGS